MGEIRQHRPVLMIVAVFSRYDVAFDWARDRCCQAWGPSALESAPFRFDQTTYYERSMGPDLKKQFFVFERLVDPALLVERKLATNQWEQEYARRHEHPETRPLNLDPGYVTEAKLVLASTKDRDHRIYLDRGIFAENTLYFRGGHWQIRPWTYPDYQQADYHQFLTDCRDLLRRQ